MLNNNVLKIAKAKIEKNRKAADDLAMFYLQKALENEKYNTCYKKLKEAQFENAKCEAYNIKPKHDTKKLENELDKALKETKIKKELLSPNYTCKKCNDTGYVNSEMCDCLKKEINDYLFTKSGFNHELMTFDKANFDLFDDKEKMKTLYLSMQKWCNKQSSFFNIVFSGKTGVGKTCLTECMASELIKNNKIVYFTSAFNLNQTLLKFHTTFDDTKAYLLDDLLEPEYLFIDDLGTEPQLKNVTVEGLYNIITNRNENGKKTIISTNLNLAEIEKVYGERIFSRLVNKSTSLCFNITNSDLRLKN